MSDISYKDYSTGEQIFKEICRIRNARKEEVQKLLADYDKIMDEKIAQLRNQCEHSVVRPYQNWEPRTVGWECVWCGHVRLSEEE